MGVAPLLAVCICMHWPVLPWILKQYLCTSLGFSFFVALSFPICCPVICSHVVSRTLGATSSIKGVCQTSPGAFHSVLWTRKLSQGSKLGHSWGVAQLSPVSLGSLSSMVQGPMSWQQLFHIFCRCHCCYCYCFGCFKWLRRKEYFNHWWVSWFLITLAVFKFMKIQKGVKGVWATENKNTLMPVLAPKLSNLLLGRLLPCEISRASLFLLGRDSLNEFYEHAFKTSGKML